MRDAARRPPVGCVVELFITPSPVRETRPGALDAAFQQLAVDSGFAIHRAQSAYERAHCCGGKHGNLQRRVRCQIHRTQGCHGQLHPPWGTPSQITPVLQIAGTQPVQGPKRVGKLHCIGTDPDLGTGEALAMAGTGSLCSSPEAGRSNDS